MLDPTDTNKNFLGKIMATVLRNTDPLCSVIATHVNALKLGVGAGSKFHLDASEVTVRTADAAGADDPAKTAASILLVNECLAVWEFHKADTLAHKVVDATTVTAPAASSLATAYTLANELKADFNVHNGSTTYHYTADTTDIAAADANSVASLVTLVNAIKSALNTHMADAPAAPSIRLVSA